jgi:hypothetical protein
MPEIRKRCIQTWRRLKTRQVIIDTPNKKAKVHASGSIGIQTLRISGEDNYVVSALDTLGAISGAVAGVGINGRCGFALHPAVYGPAIGCLGELFFDLADARQSRSIDRRIPSSMQDRGLSYDSFVGLSRITKGSRRAPDSRATVIPDNR